MKPLKIRIMWQTPDAFRGMVEVGNLTSGELLCLDPRPQDTVLQWAELLCEVYVEYRLDSNGVPEIFECWMFVEYQSESGLKILELHEDRIDTGHLVRELTEYFKQYPPAELTKSTISNHVQIFETKPSMGEDL